MCWREFSCAFHRKASPSHFFWGSFDLCCTRFSGRAPPRKGVITSESYSHECSSVAGGPEAENVAGPHSMLIRLRSRRGRASSQCVRQAGRISQLREFVLMYDDVRRTASPRDQIWSCAEHLRGGSHFCEVGSAHSSGNPERVARFC